MLIKNDSPPNTVRAIDCNSCRKYIMRDLFPREAESEKIGHCVVLLKSSTTLIK